MSKKKGFIAILIILSFVLNIFEWNSFVSKAANDNQLDVFLAGTPISGARHHVSFFEGEVSGIFSYNYKGGVGVKSSSYSSTNTSIFIITSQNDGKCKIKAKKEGTAYLELKIVTYNAITIKERIFISVYSKIPNYKGIININQADVYRGAATNANVENADNKGQLVKNNNVTIYGKCGNFYVISQTNTMFSDGLYTGFIFKSAVIIPPTKLTLDEDDISLEIGESQQLETSFEPDLAYKPNVIFESENPRIAKVDASGKVTGVKVGQTSIVAKTVDGKLKAACSVDVTLDEEDKAWTENNANKKISTSSSNNKTSKTTKTTNKKISGFQIKVQGIESKKIQITWNKQSGAKKYLIERKSSQKGKLKKIATVKKSKNKYIDKKVKAKKKYWYRVVAKKAKKKNDKKSKVVSGKGKNLNVEFGIELLKTANNEITISWKIPKYTEIITVQKKEGNGVYRTLDEFADKTTEYIDNDLKYNITYKYRVLAKRTLGKTLYSNEITYTPTYTVNKTRNLEFFKNNYPFVCRNASRDMNQYSVFSGYYSPIKYKFTGDTLEIHLYFEFTRYDKTGKEVSVEKNKGIGKESYISLFKQGLKKWHATYVVEDKYEFKNINFKVVDVIHDKSDKESYNSNQQFTKVLIGGIDPWDEKSKPWYHAWSGVSSDITRVYMPYIEDTKKFNDDLIFNKNYYSYAAAHEMGHVLGLADAYTTEDGKYDRFSDNPETGKYYQKDEYGIKYNNIMFGRGLEINFHPNDIQMILAAYSKNKGRPWQKLESYKTVPGLGMTISSEISNHNDYYVEGKK